MTLPGDPFEPLDELEYELLDALLLSLDNDEGIFCVSQLDGFFTAIVSGPITIPPSQWLEAIWGGHEASPTWETEEEFELIFTMLMRHMNSTAATLMEAPQEFEPLFLERMVDEKSYTIVDEWCDGYMKGVALCPQRWNEMPSAHEDFLAPMLMFTTENGWQQLDEMNDHEISFWQGQIEPAARRIHAYWLERRGDEPAAEYQSLSLPHILPQTAANDEPFIREQAKVGRNDPCPCGSGKKYKKCCGLH